MKNTIRMLLTAISLVLSLTAKGEQYALLIGINDYTIIRQLEGPLNDVQLISEILQKNGKFSRSNIKILTNEQASKRNIIAEIKSLFVKGKMGDLIFIYFSGHGTSAADVTLPVNIPRKTGALIPYDITNIRDEEDLLERLLIGKRDIRPLLMQFDKADMDVLMVIDACYSGNVIRNREKKKELPTRYIRFADMLPVNKPKILLEARRKFVTEETYPYKNVFSLSAAQEYEIAQEIPRVKLSEYPTIDGKPHGAFTDSLARVLSGQVDVDTNNDKMIEIGEMYLAVKSLMNSRNLSSTPKLLPEYIEGTSYKGRKLILFENPLHRISSR
jgi:hypothetical protein